MLEVLDLRTNTLHSAVPVNLDDGSFRHDPEPHAHVQSRLAGDGEVLPGDGAFRLCSTMTKSSGSHWKMELQNEEVLSVLV